jgi:hypothetical protein
VYTAAVPQLLEDIIDFLWAIISQWAVLLTGGIIIAALGAYERFQGRNVSLRTYLILANVFLLASCFWAWRDQHNRTIETTKRLGILERPSEPFVKMMEVEPPMARTDFHNWRPSGVNVPTPVETYISVDFRYQNWGKNLLMVCIFLKASLW